MQREEGMRSEWGRRDEKGSCYGGWRGSRDGECYLLELDADLAASHPWNGMELHWIFASSMTPTLVRVNSICLKPGPHCVLVHAHPRANGRQVIVRPRPPHFFDGPPYEFNNPKKLEAPVTASVRLQINLSHSVVPPTSARLQVGQRAGWDMDRSPSGKGDKT
jgi:hypothetical protein